MASFAKVKPTQQIVGGKVHIYRSKMEYRWAVWCQLRKEQGIIKDWFYEDTEAKVETKTGDVLTYRPDFTIITLCPKCEGSGKKMGTGCYGMVHKEIPCLDCYESGEIFGYEETKGWFTSKDYTKMKLFAEQYENPLTLIFASLSSHNKSSSGKLQYGRAKRLEKLLEANGGRVIYDAQKTIFKPIKHLFEV